MFSFEPRQCKAAGTFCCSAICKIDSSVGEGTIFSTSKQGAANPTYHPVARWRTEVRSRAGGKPNGRRKFRLKEAKGIGRRNCWRSSSHRCAVAVHPVVGREPRSRACNTRSFPMTASEVWRSGGRNKQNPYRDRLIGKTVIVSLASLMMRFDPSATNPNRMDH